MKSVIYVWRCINAVIGATKLAVFSMPDEETVAQSAKEKGIPLWWSRLVWWTKKTKSFPLVYGLLMADSWSPDLERQESPEDYNFYRALLDYRDEFPLLWKNSTFAKLLDEWEIGDIRNINPLFVVFEMWDGKFNPRASFLRFAYLFEDITADEYDNWITVATQRDQAAIEILTARGTPLPAVRPDTVQYGIALFERKRTTGLSVTVLRELLSTYEKESLEVF